MKTKLLRRGKLTKNKKHDVMNRQYIINRDNIIMKLSNIELPSYFRPSFILRRYQSFAVRWPGPEKVCYLMQWPSKLGKFWITYLCIGYSLLKKCITFLLNIIFCKLYFRKNKTNILFNLVKIYSLIIDLCLTAISR